MTIFTDGAQTSCGALSCDVLSEFLAQTTCYPLSHKEIALHAPTSKVIVLCVTQATQAKMFVHAVREHTTAPLLVTVVTASNKERAKLLDVGADDCVVGAITTEEFLARTHSLLRRTQQPRFAHTSLRAGKITINLLHNVAFDGAMPLRLTRVEYQFLRQLMLHRGDIVTRAELMAFLQEKRGSKAHFAINTHMSNLRKKCRGLVKITTVPSHGFVVYE